MKKAGNPVKMLFVSIWGMGGRRKREEERGKREESGIFLKISELMVNKMKYSCKSS
jgi:hypothetical protein